MADFPIINAVTFTDGLCRSLSSSPLPTDPDAMAEVMPGSGQRLFLPLDASVQYQSGSG